MTISGDKQIDENLCSQEATSRNTEKGLENYNRLASFQIPRFGRNRNENSNVHSQNQNENQFGCSIAPRYYWL
jgi:hypothetical protein